MRCAGFCTAQYYQINKLAFFYRNKGYITKLSPHMLEVKMSEKQIIFFFPHGCFVCWGLTSRQEQGIIEDVKIYSTNVLSNIESDYFVVRFNKTTKLVSHERFNIDIIYLEEDDKEIKLAISYGIAQSVKLEHYEDSVQKTIIKNAPLSLDLAHRGTIALSRKEITKRTGEIFLERANVNLSSEYLDTPDFFWEHPNIEQYYLMTNKFLDVNSRVSSLNQRLNVLYDLLNILNSQLEHRHSVMLETVVIILILIEVILNLIHFSI